MPIVVSARALNGAGTKNERDDGAWADMPCNYLIFSNSMIAVKPFLEVPRALFPTVIPSFPLSTPSQATSRDPLFGTPKLGSLAFSRKFSRGAAGGTRSGELMNEDVGNRFVC